MDYSTFLGGDGSDPVVPCDIKLAFPALLHFALRYAEAGPKTCLLASANAGGENVGRGSALGALIGAQHGFAAFPEELRKLYHREDIEKEIISVVGESSVLKA